MDETRDHCLELIAPVVAPGEAGEIASGTGAGLRPGAKATEQPPDPKAGAPAPDSTCAVERRRLLAGANLARQLSLQPVAIGAVEGGMPAPPARCSRSAGARRAPPTSCRCPTSMWSSPCRARSPPTQPEPPAPHRHTGVGMAERPPPAAPTNRLAITAWHASGESPLWPRTRREYASSLRARSRHTDGKAPSQVHRVSPCSPSSR